MSNNDDDKYKYHIQFLLLRLVNHAIAVTEKKPKDIIDKAKRFVMRSIAVAQVHQLDIKQLCDDTFVQIRDERLNGDSDDELLSFIYQHINEITANHA